MKTRRKQVCKKLSAALNYRPLHNRAPPPIHEATKEVVKKPSEGGRAVGRWLHLRRWRLWLGLCPVSGFVVEAEIQRFGLLCRTRLEFGIGPGCATFKVFSVEGSEYSIVEETGDGVDLVNGVRSGLLGCRELLTLQTSQRRRIYRGCYGVRC